MSTCQGITKLGNECKSFSQIGSEYCRHHKTNSYTHHLQHLHKKLQKLFKFIKMDNIASSSVDIEGIKETCGWFFADQKTPKINFKRDKKGYFVNEVLRCLSTLLQQSDDCKNLNNKTVFSIYSKSKRVVNFIKDVMIHIIQTFNYCILKEDTMKCEFYKGEINNYKWTLIMSLDINNINCEIKLLTTDRYGFTNDINILCNNFNL